MEERAARGKMVESMVRRKQGALPLVFALGACQPAPAAAPAAASEPSAPSATRASAARELGEHAPPAAPLRPAEPEPSIRAPAARFLKGETHVHTSGSFDGHTPPVDALRFYAERGYDFVALTDHNRVTIASPPEGLLFVPGVEYTQNSTDCAPRPSPGYRCLFHTTGMFVDPARDRTGGGLIRLPFQRGRRAAYEQQIRAARALDGIVALNHPQFHFAADARLIKALAVEADVTLVGFFNAALTAQHPGGRAEAEGRGEALWDQVLSDGVLVYALATDDAHHFADAEERRRRGKFAYVGDRGWIMVRAEKTLPAIRAALLAGEFYASTGVSLATLERSRERFSLTTLGERSARTRFVGKGGRTLATSEGPSATYVPRGDEGYVRAVVEAADGTKAWTQPVMLKAR